MSYNFYKLVSLLILNHTISWIKTAQASFTFWIKSLIISFISLITMPGTWIILASYNSGDRAKDLAILILWKNYNPIIRPFQEWESSTDLKPSCQNITIGKLSFCDFCGTLNWELTILHTCLWHYIETLI